LSIVTTGSFQVPGGDVSKVGDKTYSNKPPGLAFLFSVPYSIFCRSRTTLEKLSRRRQGVGFAFTLQIAKSLPPGLKVTVITASLPIVSALSRNPDIRIILLGGEFHVDGFDLAGPIAERQLERIHVDKSFQGADGIDSQQGFATTDFRLSRVAELMMKAAKEVIIVADHTKFGKKSLAPFGRLEDADIIITSKGISQRLVRSLRRRGIRVLVTETKGARA